jgi:hypothetical protein
LGDVGEFDFDVFGAIQWGAKVEVGDVKGAELGPFAGEYTVDHELDKFEGCSFGADVAWIADSVASYCDASAVGISFFRAYLADYIAVADFLETVWGNVSKINDMKGVCTVHGLLGGVGTFETLAETT